MSNVAVSQASNQERHVLAERYKTKMCRNALTSGCCPYEHRCMFAHNESELRTTEMNLRDGLLTEEAIKAFQRVMNLRKRSTERGPAPDYHHVASASAFEHPLLEEAEHHDRCYCDECATSYTHNPYSLSSGVVYQYADRCECASCVQQMKLLSPPTTPDKVEGVTLSP